MRGATQECRLASALQPRVQIAVGGHAAIIVNAGVEVQLVAQVGRGIDVLVGAAIDVLVGAAIGVLVGVVVVAAIQDAGVELGVLAGTIAVG